MRADVIAALDGDELTVLGEKAVDRSYDRLELDSVADLTEKQAKKLGKELEADAVVTAVLGKKAGKKTLKFRLYVKGKKQKGFTVQFKSAKSKKFRTALYDKVVERLGAREDAVVAAKPVDEAEAPKKKRAAADDENADDDQDKDEDDAEAAPKKKKVAKRDEDEVAETAIEARLEPTHSANRAAARIEAGLSFGNRSLVFTKRAGFPEGPKAFRSSPVPGARVEGELYPYAFVNPDSFLAGLGVAGEYDKTLVLNLATTAEPGVEVPVNQSSFSVGGRFRYAFGTRVTSPSITLGVDYGRRRWKADRSKLMDRTSLGGLGSLDLPDTNYAYTAPGLGFRVPLGQMFALVGYGEALLVSKAGPIQKAESYGRAKIFGASGELGFDVVIAQRFLLRASFEYTQIGFTFEGKGGMLTNSRDNDPTTKDIGGATDRSIGGLATLGVVY
ncbi:MAG TPA: hypothetical protein VK427_12090 [Kofleriaceae bacterium]|nr:hypothetical protein [Kofleriaceae bacterium]